MFASILLEKLVSVFVLSSVYNNESQRSELVRISTWTKTYKTSERATKEGFFLQCSDQ